MIADDIKKTGQLIAMKRSAKGISQEKFAERVGLSRNALGAIERGTAAPKMDTFISVCRELDEAPGELLPSELSAGKDTDPRIITMQERLRNLSPSQKNQFFATMDIFLSGLENQ